jgi:hypothetical protein
MVIYRQQFQSLKQTIFFWQRHPAYKVVSGGERYSSAITRDHREVATSFVDPLALELNV